MADNRHADKPDMCFSQPYPDCGAPDVFLGGGLRMAFSRSGKSGKQARSVASGELSITNIFFTYGAAFRGIRAMKRDWIGRLGIGIAILACAFVVTSVSAYAGEDITWNPGSGNKYWNDSDGSNRFTDDNNSSAPIDFEDGDSVTFGTNGAGTVLLQSGSPLANDDVTVSGMTVTGGNYTFTGGKISSVGAGNVVLSITGGTAIFNNKVDFANSTDTLVLSNGTTVTFKDSFAFGGGTTINGGTRVIVDTTPNLATDTANATEYHGTGTLQIGGANTVHYFMSSNNDDFAGIIDIQKGTLRLVGTDGSLNKDAKVILNSGTNLIVGTADAASTATRHVGYVWGSGGISIGGNNTLVLYGTSNPINDDNAFTGAITGTGNLTVGSSSTVGSVVLTNQNTNYSGLTTIANGTLALTGSGTIANSSGVAITSGTFDISGIRAANTTIKDLSGDGEVLLGNKELIIANTQNQALGDYAGTIKDSAGGTGKLTLNANSEFTLSGVNEYTGETKITSGTLVLDNENAVATSSVVTTAGAGATLKLGTNASNVNIKNLSGTIGTVDLGANGKTLTITEPPTGTPGSYAGIIKGEGGLTLAATNDGSFAIRGSNNTYTGETTVTRGTLVLGTSNAVASSVNVVTGGTGTLKLDTNSSVKDLEADSGAGTIDLGSNTLTITYPDTSKEYSGKIIGTGGGVTLNAENDGEFTLSGAANGYTGETTVSRGKLILGDVNAVASSSGVRTTGATSTLEVGVANAVIKDLRGTTGKVDLAGNTLIIKPTERNSGGYTGEIVGTGTSSGLTLEASQPGNRFTLGSTNTYEGTTTITTGILALSGDSSLEKSNEVALDDYGTLDIAGTNNGATLNRLTGTGEVTTGSRTLTLLNATSYDYEGLINGAGEVVIGNGTAANAITLTEDQTLHTGKTTIKNDAELILDNAASLASSDMELGGKLTVKNTAAAVDGLSGNGTLNFDGGSLAVTGGGIFEGAMTGGSATTGTGLTVKNSELTLRGNSSTGGGYQGLTTVDGTTLKLDNGANLGTNSHMKIIGSGTFDFSGTTGINSNVTLKSLAADSTGATVNMGTHGLTISGDGATATDFYGKISGDSSGDGGLKVSDTGNVTLHGVNNYYGATTIGGDGKVTLAGAGSIAQSSGVNFETGTGNAQFALAAGSGESVIKNLQGSNANATVALGAGRTLTIGDGLTGSINGTYTGKMNGLGGLTLNAASAGQTLRLTNTSGITYEGGTTITKGTLALGSGVTLDDASKIQISNAGTLDLTDAGAYTMLNELSASAGKIILGTNSLTFNNRALNNTLGSVTGGVGSSLIVKGNNATEKTKLALTGESSTDIAADGFGEVAIDSSTSITGDVDVAASGALTTAGGEIDGDVTIAANGVFTATNANSATLDITGDFTSNGTTTLTMIEKESSAVHAGGTVELNGNLVVTTATTGLYTLFTGDTAVDWTVSAGDTGDDEIHSGKHGH